MSAHPALLVPVAILLNATAGYAAFRRESVTGGGAILGAVLGSAILIAGGLLFWIMLMLFFVSSSVASRLGASRKAELERMHEKGSRRDAVQAFANAGVATVALIALRATGNAAFAIAAAGAFASVNADTWASEIGVLSAHPPRSILTWRRLQRGTSGGVSLLGTAASLAGSFVIAAWFGLALAAVAIFSALPGPEMATDPEPFRSFVIVVIAGVVGTTIDSLLGATVQAQYVDAHGSPTERREGENGANARVRGLPFVTNDVVNLVSSLAAAGAAFVAAAAVA
ncbi:MAG: DUF92 domain-containing protein [Spirochaetales bacterium]